MSKGYGKAQLAIIETLAEPVCGETYYYSINDLVDKTGLLKQSLHRAMKRLIDDCVIYSVSIVRESYSNGMNVRELNFIREDMIISELYLQHLFKCEREERDLIDMAKAEKLGLSLTDYRIKALFSRC